MYPFKSKNCGSSSRLIGVLRSFLFLFGVLAVFAAETLRVHAATTDDLQIYSGRYVNGWGDWNWMPHYATNNPVFTSNAVYVANNSMALVPSGTYQVWWLKAGASVDTTVYSGVSFWVNGGATGGQIVTVQGELDGSTAGLPSVSVTAPANSWQKVTISLSSLGINNKSNLSGLQIKNGASTVPFFIDDLRLVATPVPTTVHVNVNAGQTLRTVTDRMFGVNEVGWDGLVGAASSVSIVNNLGPTCLRWPGGSWGDAWHWADEPNSVGYVNRGWGSFSPDFIKLATNTHSQAFIIVNYGSGTPEEAAYGVRMFNVTNHCNFKYWEIGNEVSGSWEWDFNTNAPFKAHDPWTYAIRCTNYFAQMKAADPTIKIGVVVDTTEDGTINNYDHGVVNPRTGVTHFGWTPVLLTYLRNNNCIPDFVIEHNYGPNAGDTQDLLWPKIWTRDAANLRQMVNDYLGNAGTNVTLEITENGTGGGIQTISLPGGLFFADSLGQALQTEFQSRVWWAMRNGAGASGADPAYYGWRKDGNGNFLGDGGIVTGDGVGANGYPTYYVAKLLTHFARGGDTVISASSDYPLLATYSVKRTNGALTLLVINKSCVSNVTANFNLSGYVPTTNATVYSYGIPQDEAARTGIGSPDVAQTSITGVQGNFSATFAPFSVSVLVLKPFGTITPEMNALYAFEGNALDTSGSGNDGTPNALSYVAGKVGAQAAQFNGTSGYVSIPRSVQDDFTVAMWVKTTDTAGTAGAQWWSGKGLVDGEVNGGGADWGTSIVNGKFVLGIGSSGGDTTVASSVNIIDGTWHHVAATRNNTSGAMAVYVDGVLRGSGTGPTGSRTWPPNLHIGNLQTGNNFLNGTLDDVRLYDRILTPGEIAALVAPPAAPTNLAATIGDANVALSWSASSNATSYYVKRSLTSGGGYTAVATNVSLAFTNLGLSNGTLYYFVVSAVGAAGEGTNSVEVSARPTSFTPTQLGFANTGNQLQLNWPADHTGWQLQTQTNNLAIGLGTNWVTVPDSTETNQVNVTMDPATGAKFFRLVKP